MVRPACQQMNRQVQLQGSPVSPGPWGSKSLSLAFPLIVKQETLGNKGLLCFWR